MKKSPTNKGILMAFMLAMSLALTGNAFGAAILQYGETVLGINDFGELNVMGVGPAGEDEEVYGVWRMGLGDATSPGCLCEGWGVAITSEGSREAGSANRNEGAPVGLTLDSFSTNTFSATSAVTITGTDVSVVHAFGGSLADDVFQVQVTITNNSDATVGDIVYRRAMDWDIPPTEFEEYVTHGGVVANLEENGGNVRYASNNGFASTDPRDPAGSIEAGDFEGGDFEGGGIPLVGLSTETTVNTDFEDYGPLDQGSVFDFAFGDLAAGDSRVFNIYYGSAATEVAALDAIDLLGADVYSLGQSSGSDGPTIGTPATFLFAFGGVGGVELGSTQSNPILPFVNEFDEFIFPAPTPRRWFDPPFVDGFTYTLEGGAIFSEVGAPIGFGTLTILDDLGNIIGTIAPGGTFDLSGFNLSEFSLTGINPLLDKSDPGYSAAFPTFLDWTGTASTMTMVGIEVVPTSPGGSVPEPGVLALLGIGLISLVVRRPKKQIG